MPPNKDPSTGGRPEIFLPNDLPHNVSSLVKHLIDEKPSLLYGDEVSPRTGLERALVFSETKDEVTGQVSSEVVRVGLYDVKSKERHMQPLRRRLTLRSPLHGHVDFMKKVGYETEVSGGLYLYDTGEIEAILEDCKVDDDVPLSEESKECLDFARQFGAGETWVDFLFANHEALENAKEGESNLHINARRILRPDEIQDLERYLNQFIEPE